MRDKVILSLLLVMFLIILASPVYSYTGENVTIVDSDIESCDGMHIEHVIINSSEVDCANLSNVIMYESRIIEPSRDIEDARLEFAVISGDTLQSGRFFYGGWSYYAPFSLENIYAGVPPSPQGNVETSRLAVSAGSDFHVIYTSGRLGYDVTLDASEFNMSDDIPLYDDGTGNDQVADDGEYASETIAVDPERPSGPVDMTIYVDDNLGNQWSIPFSIEIDNDPPEGEIFISRPNEYEPIDVTDERLVDLHLSAQDEFGIEGCRLANEDEDIGDKEFVDCPSVRPWILSPVNGEKTITYQIKDVAGNIATYDVQIELYIPDFSEEGPNVLIPSEYWGNQEYVRFTITHDESVPQGTTYEYAIFDESGARIIPWQHTEVRNVLHEFPDESYLDPGESYRIGVRTLSGGVSEVSYSQDFMIVTEPPVLESIDTSFENDTWVSDPVLSLDLTASSEYAGIKGFSYRIGESPSVPNDVINLQGNNRTLHITGLRPGEYYLTVKAINEGELSSEHETFRIRYDNSRPPIPRATDLIPGQGTLTFNWSHVTHYPSSISGYELQISTDSDFNDIVHSENVSNTTDSFEYEAERADRYHFRVRAITGAGVHGVFSDSFGDFFDMGPPSILDIRPGGTLVSTDTVLSLITDKPSECLFGTDGSDADNPFELSGGTIHEHPLELEDGESYEYIVICKNRAGEISGSGTSFQVDTSLEPDGIFFMDGYGDAIDAYSNSFYDFGLEIRSDDDTPIGGLDLSSFSMYVEDGEYHDFAMDDLGNGSYIASIEIPDTDLGDHLMLCYEGLCLDDISLLISDIEFEVIFSMDDIEALYEEERMVYHDDGYSYIGLASESPTSYFGDTSDVQQSMRVRMGDAYNYIFFIPRMTPSTIISSNHESLLSGDFFSRSSPAFSRPIDDSMTIALDIQQDNMIFSGDPFTSSRRVSVQNIGLTRDRKLNISVRPD